MNAPIPHYLEALTRQGGPELTSEPPPVVPDAALPQPELREIPRVFPEERLDADAVKITRRLSENGFPAFLVGGCVRDLLFGIRPKDYDVATAATPKDIRRLFRNCRIIGRRFRLAHVFFRDKIIEVATFRTTAAPSEGGEENGQLLIREDNTFGTAEQDAVRRDFTINALFYDVHRQVILDFVDGVEDAEKRVVRTIGNPQVRLREDPIRMLRAIRLAARLGCSIDPATWEAIEQHRLEILQAAAPRIGEDLLRMFRGGAIAPAMDLMLSSRVLEVLLPELWGHLAQTLAAEGPEEVEALRTALRVADAKTQRGQQLTAPVQLALLLAPVLLAPREGNGEPRQPSPEQTAEILRPVSQRLSISKKDGERLRQILITIKKLIPVPGQKRRNTGALARRAYVSEAVELLEIMALATGDLVDEAQRWRRKCTEAQAGAPPVDEKKASSRARRPRRRSDRRGLAGQPPEPPDVVPPEPAAE